MEVLYGADVWIGGATTILRNADVEQMEDPCTSS